MDNIEKIRHSLSHIMAYAVSELCGKAKYGIGPTIDNGFYYDFDIKNKFAPEDLAKIEAKMTELIKQDIKFAKSEVSKQKARAMFKGQPYKLELINELPGRTVTIYQSGKFTDLCKGPHIKSTKEIPLDSFKLTKIAGAYWRGDEKNKMLQRIYGFAFLTKQELSDYLNSIAEAEKRDHRKLGKELDLFTFSDLVGSGLPLYTPKGSFIRRALTDYVESLQSKQGYAQVWTPQIAKASLFKLSGHYDKYKDNMFRVISNYSDEEFFLKPMNCPQHTQIYLSQSRSYRDLPLRFTDFAMLYRDEKPGELNGLARVRSFSQDDCHIFCREDQVDQEVDTALAMTKEIMNTFGLKYRYRLSTRDPKHPKDYLGNPKTWDRVEKWAVEIMKRNNIEYFDGQGEATFYAPKMDLIATDALGRDWQLSTIQIDFVFPERFNLEYVDQTGKKVRPVMIHRAIIGSPERFIMILLEHYAGRLPVWLSPTQAWVIPIGQNHADYAKKLADELKENNVRVDLRDENESLGKKIRGGEMQKIPYLLIVGDKEISAGLVSVRAHGKDLGVMKKDEFIAKITEEIKSHKNN